jgi:hypothetical protein
LKKGNDFHKCIERVYKQILGEEVGDGFFDSDVIDMVTTAFEMEVLYIPNKFLIEQKINLAINDMASMIGYVDMIDVSNGKIVDHKSLKSKRWALTEETMKDDLQLNIYGYWYLSKVKTRKYIYFRHNQLHKIDPELSGFVEVKRSRDEVCQYWEENILPTVNEMIELYQEGEKTLYACNLKSCGDYGGCGYKPNCETDKYR